MPRKKPFSNKRKKQQLQQKRERKKESEAIPPGAAAVAVPQDDDGSDSDTSGEEGVGDSDSRPQREEKKSLPLVVKLHQQPGVGQKKNYDPNRYRLHFERESREEIERRKHECKSIPIIPVPKVKLEVGVEDVYCPGSVLDIPKRPAWSYKMTKHQVEHQEEIMFDEYLHKIHSTFKREELSYFEHNLETWRQLWRVLELSDVVLLITDVRHPALHFSPALYNHVVEDLKKKIVLVLNKVDLVPPQVAVAWRHYFLSQFPKLDVICFTSYPNREVSLQFDTKVRMRFRRKGHRLLSALGPQELFKVVESLYRGKVDMVSWQQQLDSSGDSSLPKDLDIVDSASEDEDEEDEATAVLSASSDAASPLAKDETAPGVLTIGLVGHPNVGKSSILNGLMNKKVVSTSRTPGHTKHFQTIFLTPSIRLCDCPGLVFPSLVKKQLQILSGMFPISQVQEPYSTVAYLAQRVPLIDMLKLVHPDPDQYSSTIEVRRGLEGAMASLVIEEGVREKEQVEESARALAHDQQKWTAWDVCDAWAIKRGFFTPRVARPNTYRAANSILRLAADGRISLYFRPPQYSVKAVEWERHPEVTEIMELQRQGLRASRRREMELLEDEDSEDEETEETTVAVQQNKFSLLMELEDD